MQGNKGPRSTRPEMPKVKPPTGRANTVSGAAPKGPDSDPWSTRVTQPVLPKTKAPPVSGRPPSAPKRSDVAPSRKQPAPARRESKAAIKPAEGESPATVKAPKPGARSKQPAITEVVTADLTRDERHDSDDSSR